uniref:Uncharacterized protein n=1 Tax=Arundo donax TaxID=35708 RepID=A0A0A9FM84_ARUDO
MGNKIQEKRMKTNKIVTFGLGHANQPKGMQISRSTTNLQCCICPFE